VSIIFVVKYIEFLKMSSADIQDVFRHRHILVLNCPLEDEGFSLKTLKAYVSLARVVDMTGTFLIYLWP
jgi:hypothetical protein